MREFIIQKYKDGLKAPTIAKEIGKCKRTVQKIIQKFVKFGTIDNLPRKPKKRKLSEQEERILCRLSKKNPFWGAQTVLSNSQFKNSISISTCKRILRRYGLRGYRAAKKPLLKKNHKIRRKKFSRNLLGWPTSKLNSIVYSDECRIEMHRKKNVFVRRQKGHNFRPQYTTKTFKEANSSINIWGYIKSTGERGIVLFDGNLDSLKYQELLEKIYIVKHRRYELFMQDGARCHTAKSTMAFLRKKKIKVIEDWPAQSPDLNPIENLWSVLKKQVHTNTFHNKQELWKVVEEEFEKIPTNYIKNLFKSVPKRLKLCIANKGENTKY